MSAGVGSIRVTEPVQNSSVKTVTSDGQSINVGGSLSMLGTTKVVHCSQVTAGTIEVIISSPQQTVYSPGNVNHPDIPLSQGCPSIFTSKLEQAPNVEVKSIPPSCVLQVLGTMEKSNSGHTGPKVIRPQKTSKSSGNPHILSFQSPLGLLSVLLRVVKSSAGRYVSPLGSPSTEFSK